MSRFRKMLPLLLTLLGGPIMWGVAYLRLQQETTALGFYLGLFATTSYFVWKVLEMRISLKESNLQGEIHDQGTVEFVATVEVFLLFSIFGGNYLNHSLEWINSLFPFIEESISPLRGGIGLFIVVLGFYLRQSAIRTLGKHYTLRIRKIEGAPIDYGPYSLIRHPSYLATIVINAGMAVIFMTPYSVFMAITWFFAVRVRANAEDQWLLKFPKYQKYAECTRWRLVPWVL